MPDSASAILDSLTRRGLVAALAISREIRDAIRRQVKHLPPDQIINEVRRLLRRYEPLLARTLSDANLAAWLTGGQRLADFLPPPPPRTPRLLGLPDPEEPLIHFPIIEKAAESLAGRHLLRSEDYYVRSAEERHDAFTVTGLASEDALEKVRDALAEAVAEGQTLAQFRKAVDDALDESDIGEAHLENVFRTNVGQAYAEGQRAVLDHPLVRSEFPYVAYESVHDERRRPYHAALEHLGIGGSNVYRSDDPVIRKFWAPWDFQCRCICIPLTLEDAAERGVKEAQDWLRTGEPPSQPAYVEHPPFDLPQGWQR